MLCGCHVFGKSTKMALIANDQLFELNAQMFTFVDSQEVDAEFLLTRTALSDMCTETAKLKSMNVLSKVL